MNTNDLNKKNVLITGASSGIGKAVAIRIAKEGYHVILTARRENLLKEIKLIVDNDGGRATIYPLDLTCAESRIDLVNEIQNAFGGVDILVNNAGFGWYGYFHQMQWTTSFEMINLNITALTHLTRLVLPGMRQRGYGHIINISSILGSIPSQGVALYGASKSFIDSFSYALYRENRGSNIHISVVRPGPVKTEFFHSPHQEQAWIPVEQFGITSDFAANKIVKLLRRPKRVIYIPSFFSITPWLELCFGWAIDLFGPLHLRKNHDH